MVDVFVRHTKGDNKMTKPEPLDGATLTTQEIFNLCIDNERDTERTDNNYLLDRFASVERIKSAVEWLKLKCFRELIDGSLESRDNINTFDMHELIDKAFEDVMKE